MHIDKDMRIKNIKHYFDFDCTDSQAERIDALIFEFYAIGVDEISLVSILRRYSMLDVLGYDVQELKRLRGNDHKSMQNMS